MEGLQLRMKSLMVDYEPQGSSLSNWNECQWKKCCAV